MPGRADEHLGRFLSADPLSGSVGNLQSHNAYTYTLNNPLNAVDPSGLDTITTVGVLCRDVYARAHCAPMPPSACDWGGPLCGNWQNFYDSMTFLNVYVPTGFAPAYPCPWGDCAVSPPWIEVGVYVTTPVFFQGSSGGGVSASSRTQPKKRKPGCLVPRISLGIKGALNLGVAYAKYELMNESLASTPETNVAGGLAALYSAIGLAGNATGGTVQLFGAISGKTEGVDEAATAATTVTTIGGYIALVATGDMKKASKAAAVESLGTSAFNGGFSGHIIDEGATGIQKFLVSTEMGQNFAELMGLDTTGSCEAQ